MKRSAFEDNFSRIIAIVWGTLIIPLLVLSVFGSERAKVFAITAYVITLASWVSLKILLDMLMACAELVIKDKDEG